MLNRPQLHQCAGVECEDAMHSCTTFSSNMMQLITLHTRINTASNIQFTPATPPCFVQQLLPAVSKLNVVGEHITTCVGSWNFVLRNRAAGGMASTSLVFR